MKFRHTPESPEVAEVRRQYDREVFALREEIAGLRELLAGRRFGRLPFYLTAIILWLSGLIVGACLDWLVSR